MNATLAAWNQADEDTAVAAMLACCGAKRWAARMAEMRPLKSTEQLGAAADAIWSMMEKSDWLEAFACHPRIGEHVAAHVSNQSAAWSQQEQSSTASADEWILAELAEGNRRYEERFGFTYIVCATGKSAGQMLEILRNRLASSRASELREAAEQQRQIMQIRLRKWLES